MPNRLARETSPYLLQHADNPVDWYPWGEEAFAEARARDVPILLSVGYSACHWCHVMERESFEAADVAARMNDAFVCVKVDREERPDVDRLYQGVVQMMGRGGGWPLTVVLLPDGRPFYGGTYFPPKDRFGLPSFRSLLDGITEAWGSRRNELVQSAEALGQGLKEWMRADLAGEPGRLTARDLARAGDRMTRLLDPDRGGFGGAPKFPNPLSLLALLRASRHGAVKAGAEGVFFTLDRMATGALFDQLGGGFHRYAVDAAWMVPHFEKMLYDNALLIRLYTEAWQLAHRPLHARIVERTIGWLAREMTSPEGGFRASVDADSEGEEGRFYVFTPHEIEDAVDPERAALACRVFGVTEEGNFERGRSTLSLRAVEGIDESTIDGLRASLFAFRERRTRPGLDDKVLAAWNGLAIGALAYAARVFDRPDWTALARCAAGHILETLFDGERLLRSRSGLPGLLEDYGDLSQGLVELYLTTQEPEWLSTASTLARIALRDAWDPEACAFRAALADAPPLVATVFSTVDEAWPSGATTLVDALLRIGAITSDPAPIAAAEAYLMRMREAMVEQPFAYGQLLCAADTWLEGAPVLALVGDGDGAMRREAMLRWNPSLTVVSDGARHPLLEETFRGKTMRDGKPTAYLCRRFTCDEPRHSIGGELS